MVKVAIAGPGQELVKGTTWVKVDFSDKDGLVGVLQGVHTILSFIVVHNDTDNVAQKTLIDAAIEAGVKRIAPSEWALADLNHFGWYDNKVIEYSLFQPGWFMNYLGGNRKIATHVQPTGFTAVDYEHGRARVPGSLSNKVTYTAIHDVVNVVVKAIDYEGEWPIIGGINGNTLSVAEEIAIGERLELEDLKAGIVKTSWLPSLDHLPNINDELARQVLASLLINTAEGAGTVSDEWNKIFPDYQFTKAEEYLAGVFADA
ncbi:hypothetical protein CHGG_05110 [Chaetomium globosum CBS 148.51]|uniref:NmrA-like domain-containing protein n=1 Tax=Chaetomium globosum (strain ATCC 6205 / CBS 148.51 / DSM 1962 / NBRC 6347 / NRRL 1970) TaxID=306901 RepID=Q2GZD6_CHAGB|nr:uncharacterized protein CHGG_05110 [Chaetomium globosum CBS 148.51]EAQ88491.1 hypothetical protein CHGG_05110 [Chaetomium globosum CBS 148.51]